MTVSMTVDDGLHDVTVDVDDGDNVDFLAIAMNRSRHIISRFQQTSFAGAV